MQDVLAHCFLDGGVAVVVGRGGIGGGADGLEVVGRGSAYLVSHVATAELGFQTLGGLVAKTDLAVVGGLRGTARTIGWDGAKAGYTLLDEGLRWGISSGGSRSSISALILGIGAAERGIPQAVELGDVGVVLLSDGGVGIDAVFLEEVVHLLVSSDGHGLDLSLGPGVHLDGSDETDVNLGRERGMRGRTPRERWTPEQSRQMKIP